jgi:hypothetical protein
MTASSVLSGITAGSLGGFIIVPATPDFPAAEVYQALYEISLEGIGRLKVFPDLNICIGLPAVSSQQQFLWFWTIQFFSIRILHVCLPVRKSLITR